jgi:hypothetical protein
MRLFNDFKKTENQYLQTCNWHFFSFGRKFPPETVLLNRPLWNHANESPSWLRNWNVAQETLFWNFTEKRKRPVLKMQRVWNCFKVKQAIGSDVTESQSYYQGTYMQGTIKVAFCHSLLWSVYWMLVLNFFSVNSATTYICRYLHI